MTSYPLDELLKLPAAVRAELAMTLWESVEGPGGQAAIVPTDEEKAAMVQRWAAYQADPSSELSRGED